MSSECQDHNNIYDGKLESEALLLATNPNLTPSLLEEARISLKETDEIRSKALHEFRMLIEEEKTLLTPTHDAFLLAFLRARKFDVKKAFSLLQNFWSFRKDYKYIYDKFNGERVKEFIYQSCLGYMTHRDRKGCIIFVFKIGKWDTDKYSYEDLFQAVTGVLIHGLEDPANQLAGLRGIVDLRNISLAHLKYCLPMYVKPAIRTFQSVFPVRVKGIHILSDKKIFKMLWVIIRPFLSSKLRKRIFLHSGNLEVLREHIHPSVLPTEFGGNAAPFDNTTWIEIVEGCTAKHMELLKFGYRN